MKSNTYEVNGKLGGRLQVTTINKTWGYEKVYYNNEYCGKSLVFTLADSPTSLHFHVEKHETLIVTNGTLEVTTQFNKETKVHTLYPGDAFVIPQGLPHSLKALEENTVVIEASTFDKPSDSIRIS